MNLKKVNYLFNRHALVLGSFALVIGSTLATLNWLTAARIESNRSLHLSNTLSEVLPRTHQALLSDFEIRELEESGSSHSRTVYTVSPPGHLPAIIMTAVANNGYAGDIHLIVGITADEKITGVRVTSHQETPGLGDDIEISKSDWILQFDNTSLDNPRQWAIKRDNGTFDQLTGATITPRAVVQAVEQTLVYFENHKALILKE